MAPIAIKPILCGKITSKIVIFTKSTFILSFKLELMFTKLSIHQSCGVLYFQINRAIGVNKGRTYTVTYYRYTKY